MPTSTLPSKVWVLGVNSTVNNGDDHTVALADAVSPATSRSRGAIGHRELDRPGRGEGATILAAKNRWRQLRHNLRLSPVDPKDPWTGIMFGRLGIWLDHSGTALRNGPNVVGGSVVDGSMAHDRASGASAGL